ncbi:hypothetical protein GCM10027290_08510 [Micromonospora sonneratiae]|uniref:NhaP-type Na+/H+ or K+/H+ antiporter n=1 Tax=Micromonospora sonneratiae TaxID=1184706 RepID=A0ABW3YB66_9ACTN
MSGVAAQHGRLLPSRVAEVVRPAGQRMLTFVAVLTVGWAVARVGGLTGLHRAPEYLTLATALLAVGLFASTYGIDLRAASGNVRLVLVAVSLGVLVKALLISGVLYLAFQRPEYLVLGVAVAQIDPLSFAAARLQSRMSGQAKAILSAWASFDDPITILLTVYVSAWVLPLLDQPGGQPLPISGDSGLATFGLSVAQNLLFALAAYGLWRLTEWPAGRVARLTGGSRVWWGRLRLGIQLLLLAGLVGFAVWQFLMLGLALAGLFYRPPIEPVLHRLTQGAFLLATFALGLVLVGGIRPGPGIVLGVAAYAAHALVATLIGARLPGQDRIDLLLGQQNGITAIILALLLEPTFPGTVAVVAPAVVTVNLLHTLANAVRESYRRPIVAQIPRPVGTSASAAAGAPTGDALAASGGERAEDGAPDP